jgi:NADH dehydrogenase [ubiquinone] 1 alpha subcomplex assembly factor 7
MGGPVERAIREEIARDGPIAFDRFMEIALYGEGGFYERPPVGEGPGTHFATSPHVHEVFAELLAGGLRDYWRRLERPSPFRIVEVGAGDGTLAEQLVARLSGLPVDYVAVERSAGARTRITERSGIHVAARLAEIEPLDPGVVLANELLDNLSFRRARMTRAGLVEVRVGLGEDGVLLESETPADEQILTLAPKDLEPGDDVAIPSGGVGFVAELAGALVRGIALLIDYGDTSGGAAGEVHGYRRHRLVEDVLADPGESDITAGVDLTAIAAAAESHGLRIDASPLQREALGLLGYERWARGELVTQGALLREGRGTEAIHVWSERNRAQLLVDPSGLGRLRWLCVGAGGAPAPAWAGSTDVP